MARKKKTIKAKEPVKLRAKKLANGNQSLYLDIYHNSERTYEFLKLYIVPESSPLDRTSNENTMKLAETIKAKRIMDLQYSDHGIVNTSANSKMLLMDWMEQFANKKKENGQSDAYYVQIIKTIRHLKLYKGDHITMKDVTKDYCLGFISYLNATSMAKVTTAGYFRCLNCGLNAAVKAEIITGNPITKIPSEDRIKVPESNREYLTQEEIVKLVHTPCSHPQVKMAYLFGCMCALRLSDVKALRWGDIQRDGNQWRASILMVKTQRKLWLPLSDEAIRWLPERGTAKETDFIFSLPCDGYLNKLLKDWVKSSGIKKRITFHTSRHTNATLLLSLGVDLYTVSKLLGHTQIKTTQIYAKIVDKKKDDAVNMIPSFSATEAPTAIADEINTGNDETLQPAKKKRGRPKKAQS